MALVTLPLHEPTPEHDGAWPHILLTSDEAHYADSAGELVDLYLPGYDASSDHAVELAERSIEFAEDLQGRLLALDAQAHPEILGDEAILTLLAEDKHVPIPTRGDEVLNYEPREGEFLPTLVVANAAYLNDDGTMLPMPTGKVIIIDGSGEKEFLASLEAAGFHRHLLAAHDAQ